MKNLDNIHDSIGRSRELVTDIRTGRVRIDGEHAAPVVARLCEYADELVAIMADNYVFVSPPDDEQARLRDALLAEVPASQRTATGDEVDFAAAVATGLAQFGDDTCKTVTAWLRAARRDGAR